MRKTVKTISIFIPIWTQMECFSSLFSLFVFVMVNGKWWFYSLQVNPFKFIMRISSWTNYLFGRLKLHHICSFQPFIILTLTRRHSIKLWIYIFMRECALHTNIAPTLTGSWIIHLLFGFCYFCSSICRLFVPQSCDIREPIWLLNENTYKMLWMKCFCFAASSCSHSEWKIKK